MVTEAQNTETELLVLKNVRGKVSSYITKYKDFSEYILFDAEWQNERSITR